MAIKIESFRTDDGKTFATEAEAEAHEVMLKNGSLIESFVLIHYPPTDTGRANPHASTAKRAIALWEASKLK